MLRGLFGSRKNNNSLNNLNSINSQEGVTGQAPPQQVKEIVAHYLIQLDKERKKLIQMDRLYQHKNDQLEHKVKVAMSTKQTINIKLEESLQTELQQRKKEIIALNKKLGNMKNTPFHIMNNVDEALIPHQNDYQIIEQKKREVKNLTNQLATAEQKFQGKYFIEHKLVNQYEVELALNKKLKNQIDKNAGIRQKYKNQTRKRTLNNFKNHKIIEKSKALEIQVENLRQHIKRLQKNPIEPLQMKTQQSSAEIEHLRLKLKQAKQKNKDLEEEKQDNQENLKKEEIQNEKFQRENSYDENKRQSKYFESDSGDYDSALESKKTVAKDKIWGLFGGQNKEELQTFATKKRRQKPNNDSIFKFQENPSVSKYSSEPQTQSNQASTKTSFGGKFLFDEFYKRFKKN